MNFVWWLVGVLATITALRFVILVFKRLTSKENLNAVLDYANDGLHNGADKMASYVKRKNEERKKKKNEPMVIIR